MPPLWHRLLQERLASGELFNLDNIHLGFIRPTTGDDWQMAYLQSLQYVEYLKKVYGKERIGDFLNAYGGGSEHREPLCRSTARSPRPISRRLPPAPGGAWPRNSPASCRKRSDLQGTRNRPRQGSRQRRRQRPTCGAFLTARRPTHGKIWPKRQLPSSPTIRWRPMCWPASSARASAAKSHSDAWRQPSIPRPPTSKSCGCSAVFASRPRNTMPRRASSNTDARPSRMRVRGLSSCPKFTEPRRIRRS